MSRITEAVASAVKAWGAGQSIVTGTPAGGLVVGDSPTRFLIDGLTVGDLYATQPHLRTVVSFVARNTAQLGRHVYTTNADGGRDRVKDSVATRIFKHPNEYMTGYDLFVSLVTELALHDYALWIPRMKENGDWAIDPVPGDWVQGTRGGTAFTAAKYIIHFPGEPTAREVNATDVVVFKGYNPGGSKKLGSSPVTSLKGTLSEQLSALEFREQMWKRGGRVGAYLTRPKDAPVWSPEARDRFIQNWRNSWSGSGANAGSTPLLEDGIELKRLGFAAKEEQWLEAATLALSTVASAYHVPPTMVGAQTGSTFSSTREFRKMLYTETLGPLISQIEGTINAFLLPLIGADEDEFLELNIQEKLQGDFVEQAASYQSAAGGPWMTLNEVRRQNNMPPIEGGDEIITPLNVVRGGGDQADPSDTGAQNDQGLDSEGGTSGAASGPAGARKAHTSQFSTKTDSIQPDARLLADFERELKRFFKAQRKSLGGSKDPEWWDGKKWNRELSGILLPHLTSLSAGVARDTAGAKGLDPDDYSVGRTTNFLKAVADSRADLINSTTRDQIKHRLDLEESMDDAIEHVMTVAEEARAPEAMKTISTFVTAWASVEAVKQLVPDKRPTKTWLSSGLPNSRHAGMDGETVPIDENFSNGASCPGDPSLGAEEVANCGCSLSVDYED